jgi:S1-C subfamily serine protease
MLTAVDQSGAASDGGLLRGDLIVAFDGVPVTGVDDLIRLLKADRIGRPAAVEVLRLGRLRRFDLTPSERPARRSRAKAQR